MHMANTDTTKVFIENAEVPWEVIASGMKRKIMAWDENLMMVKVAFEKGAIGTLHQHPHSQISHVESGKFEVQIDGQRKQLGSGDAFYIPSNAVHGAICLEAGVLIDIFSPMREDFLKTENKTNGIK